MDPELIKSKKWYKQGGISIPWFIHEGYIGSVISIGTEINTYKGMDNIAYFDKYGELERAKKIIDKERKEEQVKSLKEKWRKLADEVLTHLKKKFPKEDKELLNYIKELKKKLNKCWENGSVIELFDPWGEELVEKELEKYEIELNGDDLIALTATSEFTFIQKEKIDMNKLKIEDIPAHTKKYFYMQNSWGKAIVLDEGYFRSVFRERELKKEVERIVENLDNIKRRRKELEKEIPPELFKILTMFSRLSNWREERKEWVLLVNHYMYELLKEISKRTGVQLEILEFATPSDINFPITREYLNELMDRKKFSVYTEKKWVYGKKAKEIYKALEDSFESSIIRGNIACRGRVKGRVKLIKTYNDFEKFEKGDILVTIMTRAEHLPIMKKAAAIVTDEGGITCHAAIISREFNIPCIVGTQIASSLLKDGDLVEVDAEKGVVRKCSI